MKTTPDKITTPYNETQFNFGIGKPHICILFNDEDHSMDEVVLQIMKAISCNMQKAAEIMLAAHNAGRAVVVTAHRERCEHVAAVLEEIRLGTKVEPV